MTTIKVDIDRSVLGRRVFRRLEFVFSVLDLHPRVMYVARTQNGWHVAVAVAEQLKPATVVAIQAIVGSDWRRETFCLQKTRRLHAVSDYWRARWNVLYRSRVNEQSGC